MHVSQIQTAAALLFATFVYSHTATAEPITWTFVQTSCEPVLGTGKCTAPLVPSSLIKLDLLDINSSGTYHFLKSFDTIIETHTGSAFTFTWPGADVPIIAPVPHDNFCFDRFDEHCSWDINFASSSITGLSVNIDFREQLITEGIQLRGTDKSTHGIIDSDGFMPGCGLFLACFVDGFWSLSIPEPDSFFILTTTILSIFSIPKLRRKFFRKRLL